MTEKLLAPELLCISQLFTADYLVPVYQRNYAWRAEQIEQLISDVQDAMRAEEDYFLGNLVVVKREGREIFELIDGQQRLTTLYLLLTYLQEDGERQATLTAHSGRLQYESRARATIALQQVAQEQAATVGRAQSSGSESDAGIYAGYGIIQQYFKQHAALNAVRGRFADFLRARVTVVRAALPVNTDLNRYFEIMNTRGQQLKQVDIVKARLMGRLNNQSQRACFAWIWDACADMDTYVQMSLTRSNTSLRSQLFGADWSWLQSADFSALMEAREELHASVPEQQAVDGILSIEQALTRYAVADVQKDITDEGSERFRSALDFPIFLLHVLKVLHGAADEDEGALDDKRLIKVFGDAIKRAGVGAAEWVQHFAFTLLKCRNLFDAYIVKRQFTISNEDDGDWSLQRLKRGGTEAKPSPSYIHVFARTAGMQEEDGSADTHTRDVLLLQSMLRITYTSPRTMHWITQVLRWLQGQAPHAVSHVELANFLKNYARTKVRQSFSLDWATLPQGFAISRIVFTYLDFLLLSESAKWDFKFQFRTSIEHFYPQHPDKEQSGVELSKEYLHWLGNLALVSVSANSKFSNHLPSVKSDMKQIVRQSAKLQLMAQVTKDQGWGNAQVVAHHEQMLNLLRQDLAGS